MVDDGVVEADMGGAGIYFTTWDPKFSKALWSFGITWMDVSYRLENPTRDRKKVDKGYSLGLRYFIRPYHATKAPRGTIFHGASSVSTELTLGRYEQFKKIFYNLMSIEYRYHLFLPILQPGEFTYYVGIGLNLASFRRGLDCRSDECRRVESMMNAKSHTATYYSFIFGFEI